MQKKKIMIIDDGATVIAWVRKILGEAGYETVSRNIAIGSAAAILREHPDLVLMDIMMPALQGDDIIRDFRRNKGGADVRIVLHSSLDPNELTKKAKTCGADGFIQKTNDRQEFIRQIEQHLGDLPKDPKRPKKPIRSRRDCILVISDKPFLTATIKIMTGDYSQCEIMHIDNDLEAALSLKLRSAVRLAIIELQDDYPTLFGKTVSLLFDTYTTVPVILIGNDESIVDIRKRRDTLFVRSNPLSRAELRNAVTSFLQPSH